MRRPRHWLAILTSIAVVGVVVPAVVVAGEDPPAEEGQTPTHSVVFREEGRNPGWSAALGEIYRWGDEILFAFHDRKYLDDPRTANEHNTDASVPTPIKLARSLDGGETWSIEYPKYPGATGGVLDLFENPDSGPAPVDPPGGIDFSDPDFAMIVRVTANCTGGATCDNPFGNRDYSQYDNNYDGPTGSRNWFVYTTDRGHTWSPRYWLPAAPDLGPYYAMRARTDYVVNGPNEMQMFLAVDKTESVDRTVLERGVIAIRTTDGGATWTVDGEMTAFQPARRRIMPSTKRLDEDTLVSVVRSTESGTELSGLLEVYRSDDNGVTWTHLNTPVDFGSSSNPPALVVTDEGHLILTYGNRTTRQLEAIVSTDGGDTWGEVVVGRVGAAHFDIGYPRSILLDDGNVLTAYHWNEQGTSPDCDAADDDEPTYVAATIWNPEALTPAPDTPPTVEVTAPSAGAVGAGDLELKATASDDVGVTGVEFLVDGEVSGTDACSPHQLVIAGGSLTEGTHVVTARATDTSGAVTESAPVEIVRDATTTTVAPTTSTPDSTGVPSTPTNLRKISVKRTSITIAWNASSGSPDGYYIYRGGRLAKTVTGLRFTNKTLKPNTAYTYQVSAFNEAGESALTPPLTIRTRR